LLKKLLQNQQNLKADGIYSCTVIYFFKSAKGTASPTLRGDPPHKVSDAVLKYGSGCYLTVTFTVLRGTDQQYHRSA